MDLLDFKKLFDAVQAHFATMPALLVAAPRRLDVARLHGVHPYDTGAQDLYHAQTLEDVARLYCGGESVRCVVCDLQCVVCIFAW